MDLTLQEDERQIVAMASEVMLNEAPLERWFAADINAGVEENRLRHLAAGLGWIGFGAPESVGGSGASVLEEALLFRELGRFLGPVSVVAGATAARLAAQALPELAAQIVDGGAPVSLVIASRDGRAWRLDAASGVLGLRFADDILTLLEVPETTAEVSFDPTVTMQSASIAAMRVLAETRDPAEIQRFMLLVAAQQLGMAEAAVAASVAYGKLREQFGRAIGSFQAVRHRCVDMAVRCERARAQLLFAAISLRDRAPDADFQSLAAAKVCDDAASRNARDNIFLHGAIGVTAENAGHLFLKRALLWKETVRPQDVLERIAIGAGPAI